MLKYLLTYALNNCKDDIEFLNKKFIEENNKKKFQIRDSMTLKEKLYFIIDNDFKKITYTEAYNILKKSKINKKGNFRYNVDKWGNRF